jgi:hypothetical protein
MSGKSKVGVTLLIVGAVTLVANIAAAHVFPDYWGGPNIGGGCLQMLSLVAAITGVVLIIRGATQGKRG